MPESYKGISMDPHYRKLTAVIDMFLFRFPLHPLADVRLGTITTRYRDSAVLLELSFILRHSGLSNGEFALWIWSKALKLEFLRLNKTDEEIGEKYSYMPYMMDLGLSGSSPFSASMNPNMHYFIHVIGVTCGLERSKNARKVGEPMSAALHIYGGLLGYALNKRVNAKPQFQVRNAVAFVDEDDEDDDMAANPMPPGLNGYEWLVWLSGNGFTLGEDIEKVIYAIWIKCQNARAGTSIYVQYCDLCGCQQVQQIRDFTLSKLVQFLTTPERILHYREIATIAARILACTPSSADVERCVSSNKKLKTNLRSSLSLPTENKYLFIYFNMPTLESWNPRRLFKNG